MIDLSVLTGTSGCLADNAALDQVGHHAVVHRAKNLLEQAVGQVPFGVSSLGERWILAAGSVLHVEMMRLRSQR